RQVTPILPSSYDGRAPLGWIQRYLVPPETVIVMPDVDSAYLVLIRDRRATARVLTWVSIYPPDSPKVYTHDGFVGMLRERPSGSTYVLLTSESKRLGLQDGLFLSPIAPPSDPRQPYERYGVRFVPEAEFGTLRIYRIQPRI